MVVQNALVFDSNAFFYLNGAPAKITGDPVYPGQFRYDFFMRPSIDINQNGERASSPLYMLLLLFFSEFFEEEQIDFSSSTLASDRIRNGWSRQMQVLNPNKEQ